MGNPKKSGRPGAALQLRTLPLRTQPRRRGAAAKPVPSLGWVPSVYARRDAGGIGTKFPRNGVTVIARTMCEHCHLVEGLATPRPRKLEQCTVPSGTVHCHIEATQLLRFCFVSRLCQETMQRIVCQAIIAHDLTRGIDAPGGREDRTRKIKRSNARPVGQKSVLRTTRVNECTDDLARRINVVRLRDGGAGYIEAEAVPVRANEAMPNRRGDAGIKY